MHKTLFEIFAGEIDPKRKTGCFFAPQIPTRRTYSANGDSPKIRSFKGGLEDLQDFIPRKRFKFFTTFLIYPQNPRWSFLHLTDDIQGNEIFSEGFFNRRKV